MNYLLSNTGVSTPTIIELFELYPVLKFIMCLIAIAIAWRIFALSMKLILLSVLFAFGLWLFDEVTANAPSERIASTLTIHESGASSWHT